MKGPTSPLMFKSSRRGSPTLSRCGEDRFPRGASNAANLAARALIVLMLAMDRITV